MIDLARVAAAVDAVFPPERRETYDEWNDDTFLRFRMNGIELEVSDTGDIGMHRYFVRTYGGNLTYPFTKRHRDAIRAALDEIDRQEGL